MSLVIDEDHSCSCNFVNQYTKQIYSTSQRDFFEKQRRFTQAYKKKLTTDIYDRNLLYRIQVNSIVYTRHIIFDSNQFGSKTLKNFYDSLELLFQVYPKIRVGVDYEYINFKKDQMGQIQQGFLNY